jgi:hypothetical protein
LSNKRQKEEHAQWQESLVEEWADLSLASFEPCVEKGTPTETHKSWTKMLTEKCY